MDLGFSIDVQLLCGPGLQATKEYLAASAHPEAGKTLRCLVDSEAVGDFDRFTPGTVLEQYRRYFSDE